MERLGSIKQSGHGEKRETGLIDEGCGEKEIGARGMKWSIRERERKKRDRVADGERELWQRVPVCLCYRLCVSLWEIYVFVCISLPDSVTSVMRSTFWAVTDVRLLALHGKVGFSPSSSPLSFCRLVNA